MTWPFVTAGRHALELRYRDAQIVNLEAGVDYWRKRAEQLIDAGLVRAGVIHQPTMEQRTTPSSVLNAASMIASALSVTEIDSSKKAS